jgi:hypothetical protein
VTAEPAAWLLVLPTTLMPPAWAERARPCSVVPLDATEVAALAEGTVPDDGRRTLLALAATGATRRRMARELSVSLRTVDRRLAALRRDYGAETAAELVSRLRGDNSPAAVAGPASGTGELSGRTGREEA